MQQYPLSSLEVVFKAILNNDPKCVTLIKIGLFPLTQPVILNSFFCDVMLTKIVLRDLAEPLSLILRTTAVEWRTC